jgi:HlyD family secretion protein
LVAVVIGAILYGFLGSAPTTVTGQGLLLPPGGLIRVDAPVPGRVVNTPTSEGSEIAAGEVLARIEFEGEIVNVVSANGGHLVELLVDAGNVVAPGQTVGVVEPESSRSTAVIYLPAGQGKAVVPGMEVHLAPSTAPSEEYGEIIAEVISISEFPVSPERLDFVVNNGLLVRQIASLGAVLEVTVGIVADPDTASGFKWTSGDGPPFEVHNGTITNATVILDEESPASKLFDPKKG